jgi:hypothetical protein
MTARPIQYREQGDQVNAAYVKHLRTLRRLPKDIVLEIAGREILPSKPSQCLCGWALRIGLAKQLDADPSEMQPFVDFDKLVALYGGTEQQWHELFWEIGNTDEEIAVAVEQAFMQRVMEISA